MLLTLIRAMYQNPASRHPVLAGIGQVVPTGLNEGLEIGGSSAINIDNHTAFHLEAVQTLNCGDQNLSD